MNLTDEEREMIALSLNMRSNYIETSDVNMSAVDATIYNQTLSKGDKRKIELKQLGNDQFILAFKLRLLAKKIGD